MEENNDNDNNENNDNNNDQQDDVESVESMRAIDDNSADEDNQEDLEGLYFHADWLYDIGWKHMERQELGKAMSCFQAAMSVFMNLVPRVQEEEDMAHMAASCQHLIGSIHRELGNLDTALIKLHHARRLYERFHPPSVRLASVCLSIGNTLREQGRVSEPQEFFRRSIQLIENDQERNGTAPTRDLSCAYNSLANALSDQGELAEAWECYKKDLQITEQIEPDSLDVATTLAGMGTHTKMQGNLVEALEYQTKSLELRVRLAPDSLDVASSYCASANIYLYQGRYLDALDLYQLAKAITEKHSPDSLDLASVYSGISACLQTQEGRLPEAMDLLLEAKEIRERRAGPESLGAAASFNNIGECLHELDRLDEALLYYEKDRAITEKLAPDSVDMSLTYNNVGKVYADQGKFDQAMELYQKGREILERLAPGSILLAQLLQHTASALRSQGAYQEAICSLEKATAILLHPQVGMVPTNPLYVDIKFLECDVRCTVKDFQGALDCANDILQRHPQSAWGKFWRMRALVGQNDEDLHDEPQDGCAEQYEQLTRREESSPQYRKLEKLMEKESRDLHNQCLRRNRCDWTP